VKEDEESKKKDKKGEKTASNEAKSSYERTFGVFIRFGRYFTRYTGSKKVRNRRACTSISFLKTMRCLLHRFFFIFNSL